jgi:transposase-like protein
VSAKQLERELGVTYKTAWRMFTKIRNELMVQDDGDRLSGVVEMDETYVGGKPRASDKAAFANAPNRYAAAQKWSHEKKTPVFGMVERGGSVRAYVVPRQMQPTIKRYINVDIEPGSELNTDDARVYDYLSDDGWYHQKVQHSKAVYVSGTIHTQTIDGFWSLVKRGISGTHFHVSEKWLQGYLNEYAWRYNRRAQKIAAQPMFLSLLEQIRPA